MLPGFRFLFAATMLSMSLLIFGLGAAALLRAAHESFASNSSWHAAPEVTFAQRGDAMLPMLATLSVDTVTEKAADPANVVVAPAPSPAESADSNQSAASRPAETPALGAPKPDVAPTQMVLAENPPAPEAAPAAEAATTGETRTAAVAAPDASSDNGGPAMPQPAPAILSPANPTTAASTATTASNTATEADVAATKIATLGGPPVDIVTDGPVREKAAKPEHANDDQSAVQKRVHARRIMRRRRLAARARLAAQQLQQQQANPFAQPAPTVTPRQRP